MALDLVATSSSNPKFSVFVLGMRGSGKTVFLASMFHKLFVLDDKRGYYLTCPDAQKRSTLLTRFSRLKDNGDWPLGDQISTEYNFEIHYKPQNRDQNSSVCNFSYVDYPGAWIIGQGEPTFNVSDKASQSDSILFLLDGQKIKDYMDGRIYEDHILSDLLQLTPYVQLCATSNKPMHIVITKYDLLDPGKYPFKKIQDLLFSLEQFSNAIKHAVKDAQIRMVPVSAIGPSFVIFDPHSGKMIKRSDPIFKPMNLDTSIALTMYDQLRMLSQGLDPALEKEIARGTRKKEIFDAVGRFMDGAAKWSPIAFILSTASAESVVIIQAAKNLRRFIGARRDQIDAEIARLLSNAKNQKGAFVAILAIQSLLMQRFEERLPESNVNARFKSR